MSKDDYDLHKVKKDAKNAAQEQSLSGAAYFFQMDQQAVKLLPKIKASLIS